jgi:acyl carrier protein
MNPTDPAPVRRHLRSLVDRVSPGATYTDDQDVFVTGVVRSIDLLELIVAVEDSYGLVVDERDVFEGRLRSIDRLVALVGQRTAAAR